MLGSLTDRRDFYHQAAVSEERSRSNMTPFSFSRDELEGLGALKQFDDSQRFFAKGRREEVGDLFGIDKVEKVASDTPLFPCFAALFQGDHLGVEFALEAHQNLLRREGLLTPEQRLQGHMPLPLSRVWEGLIIDDYFVVSSEPRHLRKEETSVFAHLVRAREAYEKHKLPGSPEKEVIAADLFKAAGAEIDSRDEVVTGGMCLVGAPLAKRLGLSLLSLRTARLPLISTKLASRLSGSWVSVLLYRRCLSSVVKDFFALGAQGEETDMVLRLPRSLAEELTILACLVPVAVSDISAPVQQSVYATDASLSKGAIVKTEVSTQIARVLWLDGDRRGCYTKLDNGFRAALKAVGEFDDADGDDSSFPSGDVLNPGKPPLFKFDFIEVFGGAGSVSDAMRDLGHVVGPVLDLSFSRKYDMKSLEMLQWIIYMLKEGHLRSVFVEPPCTTFSPAAHPACRSYKEPLGWSRENPTVLHGNSLAFRSMTIIYVCKRYERPGDLEQPRLSKMAWTSPWQWLLTLGCSEAVIASCQFGSPHRKEFRLLLTGVDAEGLTRKCPGGHQHLRIEGKYTKGSAVYTWGVAWHIASGFSRALHKLRQQEAEDVFGEKLQHESVLVNDVLRAARWEAMRVWFWKSKVHINLLETSVVASLLKQMMRSHPGTRLNILLDSSVAKGALAKGRSSSLGLQPILRRAAACQIAGNLYPAHSYAPTKLNVADDPTRDAEIRLPSTLRLRDLLPVEVLR